MNARKQKQQREKLAKEFLHRNALKGFSSFARGIRGMPLLRHKLAFPAKSLAVEGSFPIFT
jgi:hypothetical protein